MTDDRPHRTINTVIGHPDHTERCAQLERVLKQLLAAWHETADRDPTATDAYVDAIAALRTRAEELLEVGFSPYQTIVLALAPHFLQPGEAEVEAVDADEIIDGIPVSSLLTPTLRDEAL